MEDLPKFQKAQGMGQRPSQRLCRFETYQPHNKYFMKPIRIYYAIPDFPRWEEIVYPAIDKMKSSGLWDTAESITFSLHVDPSKFTELINRYKDDPKVGFYTHPDPVIAGGEVYTNSKLQQDSVDSGGDYHILRLHAKGITWMDNAWWPNIQHWIRDLEEHNIVNWRDAVAKLEEGYDTAGILWRKGAWPTGHYSGTWWWTTSDYVRRLPVTKFTGDIQYYPNVGGSSNRHDAEVWIGLSDPKHWDFITQSEDFLEDHPELFKLKCDQYLRG